MSESAEKKQLKAGPRGFAGIRARTLRLVREFAESFGVSLDDRTEDEVEVWLLKSLENVEPLLPTDEAASHVPGAVDADEKDLSTSKSEYEQKNMIALLRLIERSCMERESKACKDYAMAYAKLAEASILRMAEFESR